MTRDTGVSGRNSLIFIATNSSLFAVNSKLMRRFQGDGDRTADSPDLTLQLLHSPKLAASISQIWLSVDRCWSFPMMQRFSIPFLAYLQEHLHREFQDAATGCPFRTSVKRNLSRFVQRVGYTLVAIVVNLENHAGYRVLLPMGKDHATDCITVAFATPNHFTVGSARLRAYHPMLL